MNALRWLLLLALSLLGTSALALPQPIPGKFVHDFANVIPDAREAVLEQNIQALEDANTAQLAVVTIQTLDGKSPAQYATELGEAWGVGQKEANNGIVLLVAMKERKLWISTGYGVEGVLPDATAKLIILRSIQPHFKEGKPVEGIEAGVNAIISTVQGEPYNPSTITRVAGGETAAEPDMGPTLFLILFVLVMILLIIFIVSRSGGRGHYYSSSSSSSYDTWSSGGSSGSSGGDFGGGSFGGGGAGGDW